ncbi:hypothetical protein ACSBR2_019254 [Camellia fascicularis]
MSDLGGGHENFWETQSWAFSNSDDLGCIGEKSGGKPPPDSGSNTQTPTRKEVEKVIAVVPGKKRGGLARMEKGVMVRPMKEKVAVSQIMRYICGQREKEGRR